MPHHVPLASRGGDGRGARLRSQTDHNEVCITSGSAETRIVLMSSAASHAWTRYRSVSAGREEGDTPCFRRGKKNILNAIMSVNGCSETPVGCCHPVRQCVGVGEHSRCSVHHLPLFCFCRGRQQETAAVERSGSVRDHKAA